jgi:hypothetical protein
LISAKKDALITIDGNTWVVIVKEPPFEQRRIERLLRTRETTRV